MLAQFTPAFVMFVITTVFVSVLCVPITRFPQKNKLVNFYWVGFWVFIIMIASIAGSMNTLMLLDYDSTLTANAMLAGITGSFVFFVMFGWFRLSAKVLATAITAGVDKLKK